MEWSWQKETEACGEESSPVTICLSQIPHEIVWYRTQPYVASGQRLTAWAKYSDWEVSSYTQHYKKYDTI